MLVDKISVRICAVGEANGGHFEVIVRGGVGEYIAKPWNVVVDIDGVCVEQKLVYVFGPAYENGLHDFRGDCSAVVKAVLDDVGAIFACCCVNN